MSQNHDRTIGRLAIAKERAGAALYRSLEKQCRRHDVREIFGRLAAAEDMHVQQFTEILGRVGNLPAIEDDDTWHYLETLALDKYTVVLDRLEETLHDTRYDVQALQLALSFETSSILLFTELRAMVAEPREQKLVDDLIAQEKGHIRMLHRMWDAQYN